MKHLIVTGDDFGSSHEVNEAVERCLEAGFLTQASLMVNEPCAEEAVRITQRHPALCVGLHLTLCDGRASAVSALTNAAGEFCRSPARSCLRYTYPCWWLKKPLEDEIRAQFERFRALGLPPTYWDGHAHLHLHAMVRRLALPVAVEHGFRATRVVDEPGPWSLIPHVLALWSAAARPSLRHHSIAFADQIFGLRDTSRITTGTAARILRALPEGTSEFYFHPGAEPEELDHPRLLALVEEHGITLHPSTAIPATASSRTRTVPTTRAMS